MGLFGELNEIMHVKHLALSLAHSKSSTNTINISPLFICVLLAELVGGPEKKLFSIEV